MSRKPKHQYVDLDDGGAIIKHPTLGDVYGPSRDAARSNLRRKLVQQQLFSKELNSLLEEIENA